MDDGDEFEHAEALAETGFWGRRGSGCVVYARGTGRFLVGLRSASVLEPGTWGTWGGAVAEGDDPAESAARELAEETGFGGRAEMVLVHVYSDEESGFRYLNYVAVVDDEFEPELNWENDAFMWTEAGNWPSPLHFGLAGLLAAVPDLSAAAGAGRGYGA